jgi:hypothetical protein
MSDSDQSGEHNGAGEGNDDGMSRQDVSGAAQSHLVPSSQSSFIGTGSLCEGNHVESTVCRIAGFHDGRLARLQTIGATTHVLPFTQDSDGDAKMSETEGEGESGTPSGSIKRKVQSTENPEISQRPSLVEYSDQEQPQLKSLPGGDEPSGSVKVEGLMDGSEAPNKM